MLVIVDDLARIVQPRGNGQEVARTLRSTVQAPQLVEEAQGEIVDAPQMPHAPLHALQVVLYARLEHVLDDGRACAVFLAVILVENAVSEAAA